MESGQLHRWNFIINRVAFFVPFTEEKTGKILLELPSLLKAKLDNEDRTTQEKQDRADLLVNMNHGYIWSVQAKCVSEIPTFLVCCDVVAWPMKALAGAACGSKAWLKIDVFKH